MSSFRNLKDASNKLEEELRRVSAELFSAKIQESFESGIAKKLRDLSLFASKARLLRAKPISLTPQVTDHEKDEDSVISDYGELVTWKIVEQQVVKSLTQGHAVKALITAPDSSLDPELVERKEKIIKHLTEYRTQEFTLQSLDGQLKEKEDELADLRERWDKEVGALRDMRIASCDIEEVESSGPYYKRVCTLVDKLEVMRWLVGKLVMPRTRGYDWLGDPHRRIGALKLARQANTVEMFLHTS